MVYLNGRNFHDNKMFAKEIFANQGLKNCEFRELKLKGIFRRRNFCEAIRTFSKKTKDEHFKNF